MGVRYHKAALLPGERETHISKAAGIGVQGVDHGPLLALLRVRDLCKKGNLIHRDDLQLPVLVHVRLQGIIAHSQQTGHAVRALGEVEAQRSGGGPHCNGELPAVIAQDVGECFRGEGIQIDVFLHKACQNGPLQRTASGVRGIEQIEVIKGDHAAGLPLFVAGIGLHHLEPSAAIQFSAPEALVLQPRRVVQKGHTGGIIVPQRQTQRRQHRHGDFPGPGGVFRTLLRRLFRIDSHPGLLRNLQHF